LRSPVTTPGAGARKARPLPPGMSPDAPPPAAATGVGMQIDERQVGEVTILDLKGKITLNEGDEVLKDKINSLILQNRKRILLNLADVPYIDSAGLGEIVRTYTDLLMITKLLTVFETFDVEQDALKSFS
jgi:anti-sigma B factor antagonist